MTRSPETHHPQNVPTLVVCGSVHYDVIVQLPRFPRANDRLAPGAMTLAPGGMGGNVAAAFSRLGGRARFVGTFSSDDDGACLREDLERDGVDTGWSRWSGTPGTRGFILVDDEAERAIIGYWSAIADLLRSPGQPSGEPNGLELTTRDAPRLPSVDLHPDVFDTTVDAFYCPFNFAPVVLNDVPANAPLYMDIETGHVHGWSDADIRHYLSRATVVFANHRNLADLCERLGEPNPATLSKATNTIFIETLGADGCAIHVGATREDVPGYTVDPVDTTGAGGCFAAAFMLAHLNGASLQDAASFACCAAARSVTALGSRPGVPTSAEMNVLWTPPHLAVNVP